MQFCYDNLRNEGYVSWEIGKQLLLQPSKNVKENDWVPREKNYSFFICLNGNCASQVER